MRAVWKRRLDEMYAASESLVGEIRWSDFEFPALP